MNADYTSSYWIWRLLIWTCCTWPLTAMAAGPASASLWELAKAKLHSTMLLQVHDELVLECPRDEMEATARLVQRTMAEAYPLSIPLSTEARWGQVVTGSSGTNRNP